ncbi:hypothetical protein [Humisphaera borealis]|uniref:Squalene cyclase C-terminal domain-containing protein n=1 Tax=Humisphaera borealis TaxID=2807512 RepID=A0A7M2X0A0_9BACT|nr:hypothetical protein [Humisphaera borealis]QOV91084.1 hypothetical protein IPV69_06925 [Humisphaera borealis]
MLTVRQIERLYVARDFSRLLHDLTSHRADALIRWDKQANRSVLAAAMSAIRLDELSQAHHAFCGTMVRAVLAAQEADGGWGDPLSTALCLRALLASKGNGASIDRGMAYLAAVQQDAGSFPAGPFRRMPADGHVTTSVLYLLGEFETFAAAVDGLGAADWIEHNLATLDDPTRVLWRHGSVRSRRGGPGAPRLIRRPASEHVAKVA